MKQVYFPSPVLSLFMRSYNNYQYAAKSDETDKVLRPLGISLYKVWLNVKMIAVCMVYLTYHLDSIQKFSLLEKLSKSDKS